MKILIVFLSFAFFIYQISTLPSRTKRQQNFNWGNVDDEFSFNVRPQSTTDRTRPRPPITSVPAGNTNGGTTTTTPSPSYSACIRRCPTTPQYNPICGTNRITYPNESHLRCANNCGLNVQRAFGGTCQAL